MSLPGGILSREWLLASRERMTTLEEQLSEMLPAQLYTFIKRHAALYTIVWEQGWPGIFGRGETQFSFALREIQFESSEACCEEYTRLLSLHSADDAAVMHEEQLEAEITAFLGAVPVSVMVGCFGHSHRVVFHADSYESEYQD
jgi:hypothetical protein